MKPSLTHPLILLIILGLLCGCASTGKPMKTLQYTGPKSDGKHLLVALRGIGGSIESFEQYGFIEALHEHYPEYDVIIPDAHFQFYRERIIDQRLRTEILLPAKAQGYETIWLVGTSLGGLGSLLSMAADDEQNKHLLSGAVLIAPISGSEEFHALLEESMKTQKPITQEMLHEKDDKDLLPLWQWILKSGNAFEQGNIWLAYGRQDEYSGHNLLATRLAASHVIAIDGNHRPKVFAELWKIVLTKKPF